MVRAESDPSSLPKRTAMRAEIETLVDDIKQAIDLLRRHL
jgi:hypothetical protein